MLLPRASSNSSCVIKPALASIRYSFDNTYADFFVTLPDTQYVTKHLLIDGDRVAQFVEMTGTQKGDFCGLPAAGKRFRMNCAFLFSFADDKIAHEFRIYNFTGILVQLGVLKAKPGF